MMGTEFSDVLFGTPKPVDTEANIGVMEKDMVNIVVHGHDPSLSEMVVFYANDPEMIAMAKANGATKLAILDSYDQVLSLSLLDKAAVVRAEQEKMKAAQAQAGYTVTGEGDPEIDALVKARGEAKKAKNFAEADRIRDELKERGIEITDVPGGAVWKKI